MGESRCASEVALMLFQEYGNEVYRYVGYTIGEPSDTEDIVQEIFLRVLQSWKRFNRKSRSKDRITGSEGISRISSSDMGW